MKAKILQRDVMGMTMTITRKDLRYMKAQVSRIHTTNTCTHFMISCSSPMMKDLMYMRIHNHEKWQNIHERDSRQEPHSPALISWYAQAPRCAWEWQSPATTLQTTNIYFMLLCTSTTLRDLKCMRGRVTRNHTTKHLHSLHDSLHRHHEERFEVHATQQAVFSLRHLQEDPKQLPLPFQLFQRSWCLCLQT